MRKKEKIIDVDPKRGSGKKVGRSLAGSLWRS